jgi:hypothetical protein
VVCVGLLAMDPHLYDDLPNDISLKAVWLAHEFSHLVPIASWMYGLWISTKSVSEKGITHTLLHRNMLIE